jgi:hypothetical protein
LVLTRFLASQQAAAVDVERLTMLAIEDSSESDAAGHITAAREALGLLTQLHNDLHSGKGFDPSSDSSAMEVCHVYISMALVLSLPAHVETSGSPFVVVDLVF